MDTGEESESGSLSSRESFKIDQNEVFNRDEKLKEEGIKMFLDNFLALTLHPNHYGNTDILKLKIELEAGAIHKRSRVRSLNPDQRANLKEQPWTSGYSKGSLNQQTVLGLHP